MPPTIGDYYRAVLEKMKGEVESTSDVDVLGWDYDDWRLYLEKKWGMEPIEFDGAREEQLVEVERERVQRGYDIYTDRMPGTVVKNTDVRLEIPVIPSDTIQAMVNHRLSPNTFSLSRAYPPFDYQHERGIISSIVTPAEEVIRRERDEIRSSVRAYNESIQHEHRQFQGEVARAISSKRERVAAKHKGLDDLATKVGIKLVKKADASEVVPAPAKIRSKIAPMLPPTRKPQERPVLDEKTFGAIVDLMERSCRQFEATPQAFAQLTEEGLRDVMLNGSLRRVAEHHFVVRVTIPSDESRSAEIHVLVYNLYVPQPGRRVVKS